MASAHTAPAEPRWRRLPEERPRQILEAALAVFGERGLAGARLEDIAKRAGVSKGTIYLYFPNKEELFRSMIRQTVIAAIEQGERELGTGTPAEELRSYMRRYWTLVRSPEFATIYRLVVGELHHFPDLAEFYSTEVVMRSQRLLSGIFQRGVAAGDFRPIGAQVASRMLSAMFVSHGLWCSRKQYFPHMADKTDEQVLAELMDFYFHAIQPAAPATGAAGSNRKK